MVQDRFLSPQVCDQSLAASARDQAADRKKAIFVSRGANYYKGSTSLNIGLIGALGDLNSCLAMGSCAVVL